MIKVSNLTKRFGDNVILNNINLTVEQGEIVSILGASGSGKSTFLKCINGLENFEDGKISVDGLSVSKKDELRQIRTFCSTVFQRFNLYPHLTVLENITLAPIEVLKEPINSARDHALLLLERVGLTEFSGRFPATLSGGQQQRVGICRALAMRPRYLLLDEVTSSLDPEMTGEVLDVLADLASGETAMLLVTHEIGFARKISSRIALIHQGILVVDLPTKQFFSAAGGLSDGRVAAFLSKMELR